MIKIPIEIGDTVYVGRFKNKKIIVKSITYNEYGLPMINGRPLLTLRIEKLMPTKQKNESMKISEFRKLIREEVRQVIKTKRRYLREEDMGGEIEKDELHVFDFDDTLGETNNLNGVILYKDGKPVHKSKSEAEAWAKSLGAKVISIGVNPNGLNINDRCGSTHPDNISRAVKKYKAHLGIALDGDADRIILCDERGKIIDGDQIIAMLAKRWKAKKLLKGGVVGTLMSNYGLENFFKSEKIKFVRANVGDRYVKEQMKKNKFNLGGEQSGHIILGKFATTGDGLLVALEILFSLRKKMKASKLFNMFKSIPQILENVTVKDKKIISSSKAKVAIKRAEKLIKNQGRLLIRKSGTEPKIRIMGESNNKHLLLKCIQIIKQSIK